MIITPINFVKDIESPIQLQHGTSDEVEFYTYEGDNHNLSNNLNLALQRSVDFFDKYLKKP